MKSSTITKLDYCMLCFSLVPFCSFLISLSTIKTSSFSCSFYSTCCIVCCMLYGVFRMLHGYQNIVSLFVLCSSTLFAFVYCTQICGVLVPISH